MLPAPLRNLFFLLLLTLLAGCAVVAKQGFEREYGAADPTRYDRAQPTQGKLSYQQRIRPILESRCVVCHACYDAPCQLKLGSWEGIARGASAALVYDGTRLTEAPTTRLFTDALRASEWREKGFAPVLNEYADTPANNRSASLLYRALALKQQHPLPQVDVLPKAFDFGLDREQSCPRIENYDHYAARNPLAGMPYGLPGISDAEFALITQWLEQGAPDDGPPPASADEQSQLEAWERFLNEDALKSRLMSRYLFEHLFLGHLYLSADGRGNAYKLVRSSTPPGQPLKVIATRRPFDDPQVMRVFYRLQRDLEPIVAKTHMPYRFDAARMARFRELFLTPGYTVAALPSYAPETASNALATFHDLPSNSRYRFLLDDAQFFVMNFIKGPVCRGQLALNVIRDRFWVFFADPETGISADAAEIAAREAALAPLPAAWGSEPGIIGPWRAYAKQEAQHQKARADFQRKAAKQRGGPKLEYVWDGDGNNPNATLTIFRHFDSATVVTGLVGEPPKTAWVMTYPLFERVFYLLSAGFDVYGSLAHQLHSRLYMDFLRMEGEANFIALLPKSARPGTVANWYRDARDDSLAQMKTLVLDSPVETGIRYRSGDPQTQLFSMLARRIAPTKDIRQSPALDTRYALGNEADASLRAALTRLASVRGASLAWLPESSFIQISDKRGALRYFTLLRDTGHLNVTRMLREKSELAPDENALTVAPGFIGAYPNAFYRLKAEELPEFSAAIAGLKSEADYRRLADRFALRRTNPEFWAFSDALHAAARQVGRPDGGLFDYNRLENR